ncbi:MAG: hypothetical protein JWM53_4733 [bacterium]|nr:hypothetical protein [bacterium]
MRKTPVVLGVLSIIFGSVTAVLSLLTLFIGPFFSKLSQFTANLPGQSEAQRAQMEAADASFAALAGYMKVSSAAFLIMSVALVIVGVGLYRRRAWARRAAVAWSLAGIVMVVVNFVFSVAWMQPHQREVQHAIYAAHGVTPPFELGAGSQTALVFFSTLMYCAFPTVLLALVGRRSAVNDFLPATSSTTAA